MCIDYGIVEAALSENDLNLVDAAMQRVEASIPVCAADHANDRAESPWRSKPADVISSALKEQRTEPRSTAGLCRGKLGC